ncbi:NAD(P)-binding protein [Pseudovirgaria hyperparasitica]|uniref:NAD(P)-binding protein n=1 Tax=Pseudovirgaria hyperparasitica TaxID=470096 RepID=A0A6A6W5G7_9PEZI|nr:NAD(P)-binding protein [Pseudovirgaria hyperparasitica]KAF2757196.1 NAD(P)-binding protein [Pseudovirgaria hyperparasitica]
METGPAVVKVLTQDLVGKTAVVTGASRGIGRAIALNLALRGCHVLGTCSCDVTYNAHIISLQDSIFNAYRATGNLKPPLLEACVAHLTDPERFCHTLTGLLEVSFNNRVDILVLNASLAERKTIEDMDEDHIYRNLVANVETPLRIVQSLLPFFQPSSRIIFMSSEAARLSRPGGLMYSASKAAMESAVRTLAEELGLRRGMEGTTVNSVSTGLTDTGLVKNMDKRLRDSILSRESAKINVARRIGEPDDIANVVGFLASEASRWITGSVISASGGSTKIL